MSKERKIGVLKDFYLKNTLGASSPVKT